MAVATNGTKPAIVIPEYADLVELASKYVGETVNRRRVMTGFALYYASKGIYVFRCHVPLFDGEGNYIACSCEGFRKSDKCRDKYPSLYLAGDKRCKDMGKDPMYGGINESTIDPEKIVEMFEPQRILNIVTGKYIEVVPNIGIDCGKSGLLVLDEDRYKATYGDLGDLLSPDEQETVRQISGSHKGSHLFYALPEGKVYSNATGNLPEGIDIRCDHGYVLGAPSLHYTRNCYEWPEGYAPGEIDLQPVPLSLQAILDKAITPSGAVAFGGEALAKPDLARWRISEKIQKQINEAPTGDRSSADASVCLSLVYAGASDDEIKAVYEHYPIGTNGKYVEEGDRYLALTIGSARKFAEANPRKKNVKLISAIEYCAETYDNQPLEPKWKVIRQRDGKSENVTIKSFLGWRQDEQENIRCYTIEENADEVLETELFVEQDTTTIGDVWINKLRALGYDFALNQLEDTVEVNGRRLDDLTKSRIYLSMVQHDVAKTYVDDCINVLASERAYHPVKDHLNNLVWDGKNHLGAFLSYIKGDGKKVTYGTGEKLPLSSALMTRWLIGCVARALDGDLEKPFKHQTPMLVLIGPQGMGKSSMVRWLCSGVGPEFHRESQIDPHNIEHVRSMVTKWIWEASELGSSLRKGDRDALKGFITQESHTYRKPWGRSNITKPTLCNLVGSINPETGFLDDPTGHRRFLPVNITAIDHAYKDEINIDQLWAHIVHLYKTGISPELADVERAQLAKSNEEHEVENPLQAYLQMYFKVEAGDPELKCFTADIMTRLQLFGVAISNDAKVAGRKINDALAPLGLKREFLSIKGVKAWGWRGIEPNDTKPPSKGQTIVVVQSNQPPGTDPN